MRGDTEWVLIDTETTGLKQPIWTLEVAALRFRGWERVGEPIQIFLNQQKEPDPDAVDIHGYDLAFQAQRGVDPVEGLQRFRKFVGDLPVVAHNLKYDYGKVLRPELDRRGLPGLRYGFCTMWLAQRLLPEMPKHGQGDIMAAHGITNARAHEALSDVLSLAEIVEKVYAPLLKGTRFDDFESIRELTEDLPADMAAEVIKRARGKKIQRGIGE